MFRKRAPPSPSTILPIPPSSPQPSRSRSPSLPPSSPPLSRSPSPPPKPPNYQSKPLPLPAGIPSTLPPISPLNIPKTRHPARPGTSGTSGTEAALALQTRQISQQLKAASRIEKQYRIRKRAAAARANYTESKDHLRQAWLHFGLGVRLMWGVVKSSGYIVQQKKQEWKDGKERQKAEREQEKRRRGEAKMAAAEGRVERSPVDSGRIGRGAVAGESEEEMGGDVVSENEVEIGDGEKTKVMLEKELPTPKEEEVEERAVVSKRWKGKGRAANKGKGRH
ncbi:hypothetical protein QBC36DRAFT_300650 [Triangularia setosa]|uniref:Uncharacterized protein n=1 Tax=Triangularia setosa TaxID=2587417 RepID=A0AAN6W9M7_9PEZI|nr:hypothetical protein QBC36DRAFT_300650 [Podospora setosa]